MDIELNSMSDQQDQHLDRDKVILEVPKPHVKAVKSALERLGQLDRVSKITLATRKDTIIATTTSPAEHKDEFASDSLKSNIATFTPAAPPEDPERSIRFPVLKFDVVSGKYVDPAVLRQDDQDIGVGEEQRMRIATTIPYDFSADVVHDTSQDHYNHEFKSRILEDLGLSNLSQNISISHQPILASSTSPTLNKNPLHRALREALETLPQPNLAARNLTVEALVSSFPDSYSVYNPMLLLPHNTFASKAWSTLLSDHAADSDLLKPVWQRLAEAMGTTHIAVNSPIPLRTSAEPTAGEQSVESSTQENILRSPVNLSPIYGDFGPSPTPQTLSSPTKADFKNALWVTTTQNSIHQTWAPMYTMFSRGNIREKTRLLNSPSVTMDFNVPSAVVDLYAGIGYFAFSYKKGGTHTENGIKKLLCWELNPWSVEGLRRGVELNGWTCRIWRKPQIPDSEAGWEAWRSDLEEQRNGQGNNEDFWIFEMSNDNAESFIQRLSTPEPPLIPPIRHINLGLLPTSALSWRTAVRVLDFEYGGWIHAHENVGVTGIEIRTKEIETEFQGLWDEWDQYRCGRGLRKCGGKKVKVEHIERVKMYAPGVVHCVFDVHIYEESQ